PGAVSSHSRRDARACPARALAPSTRCIAGSVGMTSTRTVLDRAVAGQAPAPEQALALAECDDLAALMEVAAVLRDQGHGARVSSSPRVFIPLPQLCRDSCHYCTFAHPPRRGAAAYLSSEEVLAIARAGAAADCKEALFTLGDKPELR